MNLKRHIYLMIPFVILGAVLLMVLPSDYLHYVYLAPIGFWMVYYSLLYIDKRRAKMDK